MSAESRRLVEKLWAYCHHLRDEGVSTIEYTEQLTCLLFLKMADERENRKIRPEVIVPPEYSWQKLVRADGAALEEQYRRTLQGLGSKPGVLGQIFRKSQNRIADPAKLKRLVKDLIDKENWSATGVDIKGDAYEELLARGAEDTKSGAGQYFTPRSVIQAVVECVEPTVNDRVVDPAAGTGGFLLVAHEFASQDAESYTPTQRKHLNEAFIHGIELVDNTARLAAMNMVLHGIGSPSGDSLIEVRDSLIAPPAERYSVVLSNPPFGRKSSMKMVAADGSEVDEDREIERADFVATTANKQFNFMQHICTLLEMNGRAAVVLPDNVLFEGGAGETIRRHLLNNFDLHTMLRLPTGIFYKPGVKANVLFFEKRPAREEPWTEAMWVYDMRTNKHFTLKRQPLLREHLQDFVDSYLIGKPRGERVESERFKRFTFDELITRELVNLDLKWLKDESLEDLNSLPAPDVIAREIVEDLTAALAEFEAVAASLEAYVETD
jgi:type I restriction enzyme M protein